MVVLDVKHVLILVIVVFMLYHLSSCRCFDNGFQVGGASSVDPWNPCNTPECFACHADLTRADLRGADLTGADLISANLTDTILTSADLTDANLTNANFITTNLKNANLTRANLTNAYIIDSTDFSGANLTDANLTSVDPLGSICDSGVNGTKWDDAIVDPFDDNGTEIEAKYECCNKEWHKCTDKLNTGHPQCNSSTCIK